MPHTLNIVLGIGLASLVVMYHGDYMQQIILAQLLETIGKLLHVDSLISTVLLLGRVLAAHTVRVGGARLLEKGEQLWLGIAEGLESLS